MRGLPHGRPILGAGCLLKILLGAIAKMILYLSNIDLLLVMALLPYTRVMFKNNKNNQIFPDIREETLN